MATRYVRDPSIRYTTHVFTEGLWRVHKPTGWTSFDVVAKIRALSGIQKVGHAGTLDPAAEGLLLVAIGRDATKQLDTLLTKDKEYIAEITFGIVTDTGDRDGTVLGSQPVQLSRVSVFDAVTRLIGRHEQVPPMHSAIKQGGKKLYELARRGLVVERKPRSIEITEAELLEFQDGEFPKACIRLVCSKGTYIRVIAEDLGRTLGTGAFLSGLVRTRIGEYTLDGAVKIVED